MDDIDKAEQMQSVILEQSIAIARQKQNNAPSPTGCCHYCQEPLPADQLFCDIGCRDDYVWEQNLKKRM
ncbi:Uncharacterised protein [Pasteurella testudinis]|nr:Uncharacterised protein [Pasteurella testudinis]